MDVSVKVITNSNNSLADAEEIVFTSGQFPILIGRSSSCDLTLEDEKKHISSKHAELSLSNSTITLTDISSNGTWINQSVESLGKGNSTKLSNDDVINIGNYQISIQLTAQTSNEFQSDLDPFGALDELGSSSAIPPVRAQEKPASRHIDVNEDPFKGLEDEAGLHSSNIKKDDHLQRLKEKGIGPNDWPPQDQSIKNDPFIDAEHRSYTSPNEASTPAANVAAPLEENSVSTDPPKTSNDDDGWPDWTGLIPEPAAATSHPQKSQPAPSNKQPAGNIKNDGALTALLLGAGLNPADFATTDQIELARHIGSILNRSTKSMMLLLRSRDEIKTAMRADVTLLAATNNSPLKFSVDVEDALKKLLTPSDSAGFTASNQAIDKGLHDIKVHQLAMLEAMRSALQIALSQFDPETLEKKTREANPVASTLPLTREAKLWEQFQMRYDQLKQDAVEDFSDVFGKELRKAYEKSVNELKRSRS